MANVRVLVLRAPGTNCDMEACYAFELVGAAVTRVHIQSLLQTPTMLGDFQVIVVPGGFSYGDDVAAGKILANQLRTRLADDLRRFRDAGKLIVGICNGFQVLVKAGLLPGWDNGHPASQPVTLAYNDSGKFEDRWIHLAADPGNCVFLRGVDRLDLPIAHGEGKFVCCDSATLQRLHERGLVVLRYAETPIEGSESTTRRGSSIESQLPYPINPNGSTANVAGISDPSGRVFGLMPHPERHVELTQHPQWTRRKQRDRGDGDGLAIFRNAVQFFA